FQEYLLYENQSPVFGVTKLPKQLSQTLPHTEMEQEVSLFFYIHPKYQLPKVDIQYFLSEKEKKTLAQ
ncbi:MAG: hypothetical protein ACD_80C00093G0001, partial [uncultured bacterium (gcode 4)]